MVRFFNAKNIGDLSCDQYGVFCSLHKLSVRQYEKEIRRLNDGAS